MNVEFAPQARDAVYQLAVAHKLRPVDLARMRYWSSLEPQLPDGEWYADFNSFIIAGIGRLITSIHHLGVRLETPTEADGARGLADSLALESVWTAQELAELFKCSVEEINKLGRQGRIPSYPITATLRRYDGPALADWLTGIKDPPEKNRK
jgi:hypothetical protein